MIQQKKQKTIPDIKLQKLKNLFEEANRDTISPKEFQAALVIVVEGIDALLKAGSKKTKEETDAINKKLQDFIALCEKQMQQTNSTASENVVMLRKELNANFVELKKMIENVELMPGEQGEPGEDAEITEEIKQEMTEAIAKAFYKKYLPVFEKEIKEAIDKAVEGMSPQQKVIFEGGMDSGAPFEMRMKNGTNTTVRKDGSGAWIVDSQGGTTDNFIDNEVASGSGTSFTLSKTPVLGSEHIFANGQRLTPTVDYTISGATITTGQSWSAGVILVDYRY